METTTVQKVSLEQTRKNIMAYFDTHDVQYVAEDATFIHLGTGEETKGRKAVGEMLHYMYHVAFDAGFEFVNRIVTENHAILEGRFRGKHIAEFAGVPATNREVNVPTCISYDLENGLIKTARIYMLGDVMYKQLTGNG